MSGRIIISPHVSEKHLYVSSTNDDNASVFFFNHETMMHCIIECVRKPDVKKCHVKKEKYILEKEFNFEIGKLGIQHWNTKKVKLICQKVKNATLVVTAYPFL